jgi:hypothetical protein
MRPSRDTKDLAKSVADWRLRSQEGFGRWDPNVRPYVLFIGPGCARAAKVPSYEDIARALFDSMFELSPRMAHKYLSEEDRDDGEKLEKALFSLLRSMSPTERDGLLQSFYERVPIPLFYQHVARLIKVGYFSHIVTINLDTLLEQALTGIGQASDPSRQVPYQVITLSPNPGRDTHYWFATGSTTTIIKLPGDLASDDVITTYEEIENALAEGRSPEQSPLRYDLVVVGYEFESQSVNDWLARTAGDDRGKLWWVNPKPPDRQRINPIEKAWRIRFISASRAEPQEFFGELALQLLHVPLERSMARSLGSYYGSVLDSTEDSLDRDHSEEEYLLNQIRNCEAELQRLTQKISLGQKDPQIASQIDYQRHQLMELENRLRNLSSSRSQIPQLFDQITKGAEEAGTDSGTLSFLQTHANVVKHEYDKKDPNQQIVSASIAAMVSLAKGLGAEVVNPQAVSELTSFARSTLTSFARSTQTGRM